MRRRFPAVKRLEKPRLSRTKLGNLGFASLTEKTVARAREACRARGGRRDADKRTRVPPAPTQAVIRLWEDQLPALHGNTRNTQEKTTITTISIVVHKRHLISQLLIITATGQVFHFFMNEWFPC